MFREVLEASATAARVPGDAAGVGGTMGSWGTQYAFIAPLRVAGIADSEGVNKIAIKPRNYPPTRRTDACKRGCRPRPSARRQTRLGVAWSQAKQQLIPPKPKRQRQWFCTAHSELDNGPKGGRMSGTDIHVSHARRSVSAFLAAGATRDARHATEATKP